MPHRSPASHERASIVSILKQTASEWISDNAMGQSAAISFYTILSLAPLLIITMKILGLVWNSKEFAQQKVMAQMKSLMGPQAAEGIRPMLEASGRHGSGGFAAMVSVVVLLFSATGLFVQLQDSMNVIWDVKARRRQGIWGFVRARLLSLAMVFGIGVLFLMSMLVSTILSAAARDIAGNSRWLLLITDIAVSLCAVTLLFAAIFRFLPNVTLTWRHVWPSACMTAALFTLGKYGLGLYFKYATPTSAFGAAGSLAAILLWVYYSSFILFFGGEFTKVWAREHGWHVEPDEHAVSVGGEDGEGS